MPNPLTPILDANTIATIDGVLAPLLRDTCRIIRRGETTRGTTGGLKVAWSAEGPDVACMVTPANRATTVGDSAGREIQGSDVEISLPRTESVDRGDRVKHVTSGEVFDVVNDPDVATYGFLLTIAGRETDGSAQ